MYNFTTLETAWRQLEQYKEALVRKRPPGLGYRAWVDTGKNTFTGHGYSQLEAINDVINKELNSRKKI